MNRNEIIAQLFDTMDVAKRSMHGHFQTFMQGMTITRPQLELLFSIKHLGGASSRDLAAHLRLTAGAVSQMADGLDGQQLIERHIDPADRRRQVLYVSAKGVTLLKELEARRRKIMEHVMQDLSDDELAIWLRIQRKIISEFKSMHTTQANQVTPATSKERN